MGDQRYIAISGGVPRSPGIDIGVRRKRIDAESFKTGPFSTLNILLASAGTTPFQALSKVACEK